MAFNSVLVFAVAHVDGVGKLRSVQLNFPIEISSSQTSSASPGSIAISNNEDEPIHEPFEVANGQYSYGNGTTADLSFNMNKFQDLSPTDQQDLASKFANGESLNLTLSVEGIGTNVALEIQLRALKTTDFLFNSNSAEVVHYGSVTGANLTLPAGDDISQYQFLVAEDLASDLSVPSGAYSALVTYDAGSATPGALAFPGAPPPVDSSVNDDGYRIKITHSTTGSVSVLRIDPHFPTQTLVVIDQSGSMNKIADALESKWDKALEAAHLFAKLYGTALPSAPTSGSGSGITSTLASAYKIKLGSFNWSGTFSSSYTPSGSNFNDSTSPPTHSGSAGGATPIGEALVEAKGFFTVGDQWRRRHLLLLTDGMDNVHSAGAPSLVEVLNDWAPGTTTSQVHIPTVTDNPTDGVVAHTFSYALNGEAPVFDLANLATKHKGLSLLGDGTSDPEALDPQLLREKFIDVLGMILPVERQLPSSGTTFTVEDGLERVIFIATEEGGSFSAASATTGQSSTSSTQGYGNGFSWAWVDNPIAAIDWEVSNVPTGAEVFALFDPSLRMRCSVESQGLGQPIKLRARVTHWGAPVRGAAIRVGVHRPGESLGELLTTFLQTGGLVKTIQRGYLSKQVVNDLTPMLAWRTTSAVIASNMTVSTSATKVTASKAALGVGSPDSKSLQRLLLDAAEKDRNLRFQSTGNSVALKEVEPGRYEGELEAAYTQMEGVYNFHFRGDGYTPTGHAFGRNQWRSTTLAPLPDPAFSEVSISSTMVGTKTVWAATVIPRTATNKPIGPGLGYALAFHYIDPKVRKELLAPVTIDNIDGTYSTRIELDKGLKVPKIGLFFGSPDRKGTRPLVIEDTSQKFFQVKVILNKLQVLDDKDGCISGAGELAFDTLVAPNANPNRAVRRRLPEKGYLNLSSGQTLEVNEVIYEGLVEPGASLSVAVGGTEFDFLCLFTKQEKLARYCRVLSGPIEDWAGEYTPDNEVNDPELLKDWALWYSIIIS